MTRLYVVKGIEIQPASASLQHIIWSVSKMLMTAPSDTLLRPAVAISPAGQFVLRLLSENKTPKQIAGMMPWSVKVVYAHKSGAIRKLGLKSRLELHRLLFSGVARPFMDGN